MLGDDDKGIGQVIGVGTEESLEYVNLGDRALISQAQEHNAAMWQAIAIRFFAKVFVVGNDNPIFLVGLLEDVVV